jgi:membrane protein implicated in regulation of membrane protease activity
MSDFELWLLAGLILLGAEILLPGVFMLWLGIAALATGGLDWLTSLPRGWQVVSFTAFAALSITIGLVLRGRTPRAGVNAAGSGLIGRRAISLGFERTEGGAEGRVRLGDSDWPARLSLPGPPPAKGARLVVVGVSGTCLLVDDE